MSTPSEPPPAHPSPPKPTFKSRLKRALRPVKISNSTPGHTPTSSFSHSTTGELPPNHPEWPWRHPPLQLQGPFDHPFFSSLSINTNVSNYAPRKDSASSSTASDLSSYLATHEHEVPHHSPTSTTAATPPSPHILLSSPGGVGGGVGGEEAPLPPLPLFTGLPTSAAMPYGPPLFPEPTVEFAASVDDEVDAVADAAVPAELSQGYRRTYCRRMGMENGHLGVTVRGEVRRRNGRRRHIRTVEVG